ncbi:GTP-binding protein [Nonomuraea sp. NPDC050536]|uniref:GTP-binding protein n=1 Tax=Nonomuraea sp. NPDC050536 TaxID=3364366 RepID=UPI0037C8BABF
MNIGILAHVDAGKTSLTERLLFQTGAIDRLGSVDGGDTQTDTGDIERRRGITIRTAVAAFTVGDLHVNLIDTPGHSDFIAEVERALGVLDGAILVVSAVEGVQPQTRVLMKTLRRLALPTLIFVNKLDRAGARPLQVLGQIRRHLSPAAVTIDDPDAPEILAEHDDAILKRLVEGDTPTPEEIEEAIARQCAEGVLHPVFLGSAMTGQGVTELLDGLRLLPTTTTAGTGTGTGTSGTVFAIERGPTGEKVAYVRLRAGTLHVRRRTTWYRRRPGGGVEQYEARPTALRVIGGRDEPCAGDIAKVWGVPQVRVGDRVGSPPEPGEHVHHFAPPSLETVVRPRRTGQRGQVHAALAALAEQDPLISIRTLAGGQTSVLLYGEVQKEVIAETLARDFGVEAEFEPSSPVYLERPAGVGETAEEITRHGRNDFWATVGLRVEPGPRGSGLTYRLGVELGSLPAAFQRAIEDTVAVTLRRGPQGWPVTDVIVTLTRSGYASPISTASDFRGRTAEVLMDALQRAGTRVYEPCHRFELEIPAQAFSPVTARLAGLGAELSDTLQHGDTWLIRGELPARRVHDFERQLPGLSHGEGVWLSAPSGDRPL